MKLIVIASGHNYRGALFAIECNCGWRSKAHFTLEAAGRDADLHIAEKFPIGRLRRPCDAAPVGMMTRDALELGDCEPPLVRTGRNVSADHVGLLAGDVGWTPASRRLVGDDGRISRRCAMDAMTIGWAWTNGLSPEECAAMLDERHGKESKPPCPGEKHRRGGQKRKRRSHNLQSRRQARVRKSLPGAAGCDGG